VAPKPVQLHGCQPPSTFQPYEIMNLIRNITLKKLQKISFSRLEQRWGTETAVAEVPVGAEFPPLFIINFNKRNS
jgi:hypothetical protein